MKYSVLMSVYKKDSHEALSMALNSIYESQTRKPDEIVIVFDGPLTDQLYKVLDDFASDKKDVVRYFPQSENRGLGEALRIGAEMCTGDYVFRMDADDVSVATRFEKQANFLEDHPEVDVLGTATEEFNFSIDEEKKACIFPQTHEEIVKMAKRRNPINHMSVCMRREALIKVNSYQPLMLLEDYYLWLRMMVNGCKFANLSEPLVYVRVGNGFYSRRSSKVQIKGWKFLQNYMLEHKLITRLEKIRNMITVRVFVMIPPRLKAWIYKTFLRK